MDIVTRDDAIKTLKKVTMEELESNNKKNDAKIAIISQEKAQVIQEKSLLLSEKQNLMENLSRMFQNSETPLTLFQNAVTKFVIW